jgi:hypothetical protein
MNSCDDKKAEILFTTESIQPTQFLDSGACWSSSAGVQAHDYK